MNAGARVESSDRRTKDYFHFGLTAFGAILVAAGVVILSWRTVACGVVLIIFGLAYFGLED